MRARSRLLVVTVAVAVIAVPAAVLRLGCVGNTCANDATRSAAKVPFCTLPAAVKDGIAAGFRAGRSPDVLGVTGSAAVLGGTGAGQDPVLAVPWPAANPPPDTGVPIVFAGRGVSPGAPISDGATLDRVAPTISEAIGFRRPHPGVRSGSSLTGVASGDVPRLVLEVAWKGVGSADLQADRSSWPFLRGLQRHGSGTLDARTGSLPLDPTAVLTTIGTGGLPAQHGITGGLIRGNDGRVVPAWGEGAPPSVIATLPDDYDHATGERPLIGLVATSTSDRGIVGRHWYPGDDADPERIAPDPGRQTAAAEALLRSGFGGDPVTDILAVVAEGPVAELDVQLRTLVAAARRASGGSVLVVVAGTGSVPASGATSGADALSAGSLVHEVDAGTGVPGSLIAGAVPGGLFLDEGALTRAGVTGQVAQRALAELRAPDGSPLMADAFQGFAVSFGRYC